jgi:small subunit ribosomal protein S4
MINPKCKICRRLGVSICSSSKCPLRKRPYPPGQKGKRRAKPLSEFGKELKEKQKLRYWYNLPEKQFKNYVKEILASPQKGKDAVALLIKKLESRLDNVVFRLGFAATRPQSRQLVAHGHFLVNGRVVNIPSYEVKIGDIIKLKDSSREKIAKQNLLANLKKHKPPSWLQLDPEKLEGKILKEIVPEEVMPPFEISFVFEHYSI